MTTWRQLTGATALGLMVLSGPARIASAQDATLDCQPALDDPSVEQVHSWSLAPGGSSDPAQAGNRVDLAYDAVPGTTIDDAVTLYNYSNVTLNFRVYATDAFNNDAGEFDILPGSEEPTDVGSWVALAQENITVVPCSQATIPLTITIPVDASPGDHAGAVVASSETSGSNGEGQAVTVDRRTGTRMFVRVAGPVVAALAIEDVTTDYRPSANPFDGTAKVSYRIVNRGNVRQGGIHSVTVSGPLGLFEKRSAPSELAELLPGQSLSVTTELDGVPALGWVSTRVDLEPDGDAAPVSRTNTTVALPITFLLLLVVVILGVLAWRARRRHQHEDVVEIRSPSVRGASDDESELARR
jgi:WxL Interacting Protein, peptidoglycan binding domain